MIRKVAGIVIKNKSVLYLRKKNFLYYILPGGKIEKGESKEDALKRELLEELSSRIEIKEKLGKFTGTTFNEKYKPEKILMDLYLIKLLNKITLSGEIIDFDWIKHKNIHRYLLTPIGIKTIRYLNKLGLIE